MSATHSESVTERTAADATFNDYHDDGVATIRHWDRWQKHGKDRIYPGGDQEGHIDLKRGELVDLQPHPKSNIEEYELEYCVDDDNLYLWAIPEDGVVEGSLSKRSRKEIARIPRQVMGWGVEN